MIAAAGNAASKALGGIVAVLAIFAGLVVLAPSAFAHHANIDATLACDTSVGQWRVTYTTTTWTENSWNGSHTDIEVFWNNDQIGPETAAQWRADGTRVGDGHVFDVFNGGDNPAIPGPERTSATGNFLLPAGYTGTFYLATFANGGWGPNPADVNQFAGGNETWGTENGVARAINVPTTPCNVPGNPGASASTDCVSGVPTIRITLSNTGGSNVTFTISSPAQSPLPAFNTTKTLTPNDTTDITVDVPANEDTARTVTVTAPGGFSQSFTRTVSCQAEPDPEATVVGVCNSQTGGGTVTVDLSNDNGAGGESVVLFIDATGTPAVADEAVTLAGGGTAQRVFQVAEGNSLSVQVKLNDAGGQVIASQTGAGPLFDCTAPAPAVSEQVVCASGEGVDEGISFTLSNGGTEPATFNISGGPQGIVIGPGGSDTVFLPVAEGASWSFTITATGGFSTVRSGGPLDCDEPVPAVAVSDVCAEGGVAVTFSNTGDEVATFTITNNGNPTGQVITIQPGGAAQTVTVVVAEGAAYSITATVPGATVSGGPIAGTRDCQHPTPTGEHVCVAGGIQVSFTNTGETATVTVGTTTKTIANGATETFFIPVDEGETYNVQPTSPGNTLAPITGTRDCQEPEFGAVTLCATGPGGAPGVTVTLTNSGSEAVTVKVDHGVGDVVVPGGGAPVSVFVAQAENAAGFTLTGTSSGNPNITIEVPARNCQGLSLELDDECVAGGATVSVTNTGTETAAVSVNGSPLQTIPAGESRTFFVAQAEGSSVVATATSTAGDTASTTIPARDCQHPAPTGTHVCVSGGIEVSFTNTGETTTVTVAGVTKSISSGATETFFIPVAEGQTYNVQPTSPGNTLAPITGTRDCQEPEFGAVTECATNEAGAPGVTVTLTNEGSDAVTVNVDHGVGNVAVPANGSVSVFVPQAENDPGFTLTGTSAGNPDTTIVVPARDCQGLSLVVTNICVAGGATVTVSNDGSETATGVTVNGSAPQDIPAGESRTFFVAQAEGSSVEVTATSTAGDTASTTIPARDCQRPALLSVNVCAEGGTAVTITNGPEASEPVTVTIGSQSRTIDPGANATFLIARPEGAPETTVQATSVGNLLLQILLPARDCVEPGAPTAEIVCAEGEGSIVLTNGAGAENDAVFTVVVTDGGEPVPVDGLDVEGTVSVAPDGTVTLTFPVEENHDFVVTVSSVEEGDFEPIALGADCLHADSDDPTFSCAEGDVEVVLRNTDGEVPVTFTITITGDGDPKTFTQVVEGPDETFTYTPTENSTVTVTVTAEEDGYTVTSDPITVNCVIDATIVSGGVCSGDVPFVAWTLVLDSPLPAGGVTVEFLDASGAVRQTLTGQGLSGSVLWPGVVLNSAGDPVDWPGWLLVNGQWVRGDDGFAWARPTMGVRFGVNPTFAPVTVAYPDPSPTCLTDPPAEVLGVQTVRTATPTPAPAQAAPLAATGTDVTIWLVLAGLLLLVGGSSTCGSILIRTGAAGRVEQEPEARLERRSTWRTNRPDRRRSRPSG